MSQQKRSANISSTKIQTEDMDEARKEHEVKKNTIMMFAIEAFCNARSELTPTDIPEGNA